MTARETIGGGTLALEEIEESRVDDRVKGIPGGVEPFALREIGDRGWNVLREELSLPAAVLRESALQHNSAWMRRFVARSGADIAPHGKTTMSPQLFARQLADGAWGITVATIQQLQVCRRYGVPRVILANQLVDRRAIRWVVEELRRDPDFELFCLVDSLAGVQRLREVAEAEGAERPIEVLLEMGYEGGRAGCRTRAEALDVARAVAAAAPFLRLRGVEGFEGLIAGATAGEIESRVRGFLDLLIETAGECDGERLFAPGELILTAGGSAFFDLVLERLSSVDRLDGVRVVTRSGCYFTHDSLMYRDQLEALEARSPWVGELGEGLRPALEVWAHVQSRPEPGRAILAVGKRDCGTDAGLPVPLRWFRPGSHDAPRPAEGEQRVTGMNDQHAFLELPADSPLEVGDLVCLGVSHPCTTLDRWEVLFVVDDDYDVVSAVRTFF